LIKAINRKIKKGGSRCIYNSFHIPLDGVVDIFLYLILYATLVFCDKHLNYYMNDGNKKSGNKVVSLPAQHVHS